MGRQRDWQPNVNTEAKQALLAQLKAELAAQPLRQSRLADYDDLIAAMRQEGAAWRTVARYLAKAGVTISAEAIRAYWRRHHGQSRKRSAQPSQRWTFNPPSTLE